MPVAAGVAVSAWLGGTAVLGTVGVAVVTGAVAGVITGGLIGAATAVLTGGDIIEGTLKGALIGGVTGGVLNGIAEGVFGAGVGVKEAEAAGEFLKQSPNATLSEAVQYGKDYVTTPTGGSAGGAPGLIQGGGGGPPDYSKMPAADLAKLSAEERVAAIQQQTAAAQSTANSQALKTSAYIGLGTGVGTGVFQLAGNKMAANAREEELQRAEASARARAEGNQAGAFQRRIAKFQLPEAWTTAIASPLVKYRKPAPGLLQAGGAV